VLPQTHKNTITFRNNKKGLQSSQIRLAVLLCFEKCFLLRKRSSQSGCGLFLLSGHFCVVRSIKVLLWKRFLHFSNKSSSHLSTCNRNSSLFLSLLLIKLIYLSDNPLSVSIYESFSIFISIFNLFLHKSITFRCLYKMFLFTVSACFSISIYYLAIPMEYFFFFVSLHKPVDFYCFYFLYLSKNKLLLNQILKLFHRSIFYFVAFSIFYGFDISKGPLENISFLFLLCCIRCYLLAYFLSLHSMFSHINTF